MRTLLRIIAMVALTFLMLSLTKCDSKKTDNNERREVQIDLTREREKMSANLQELLKDIDREIDKVDRKLEQATGETKARLQRADQELSDEREKVTSALEKVEKASDKTWADVKLAARNTAYDVRDSFHKLGNELANVFAADNSKK
jgi:predicted phage tail protein